VHAAQQCALHRDFRRQLDDSNVIFLKRSANPRQRRDAKPILPFSTRLANRQQEIAEMNLKRLD
jgi:hypothetical protein